MLKECCRVIDNQEGTRISNTNIPCFNSSRGNIKRIPFPLYAAYELAFFLDQ